ncbi:Piwi-domain-containing protein [Daldinia sp. FL1419]|nr:Piwi-domain-containing protein [Daldinia sp. FL1419]
MVTVRVGIVAKGRVKDIIRVMTTTEAKAGAGAKGEIDLGVTINLMRHISKLIPAICQPNSQNRPKYYFLLKTNRQVDNVTEPSQKVTNLEDKIILSSDNSGITPSRPGYGTKGVGTVLQANYFELIANGSKKLYQYEISFKDKERQPKGKKLARVIKLLLDGDEFKKPLGVVTDFANTLISHEELRKESVTVSYYDERDAQRGSNTVNYTIGIKYKETLSVSDLIDFLKNPRNHYERGSIVKALNIFLNHYPLYSTEHLTIGSSRSFPVGPTQCKQSGLPYMCSAIKGYYSSIQLATSRILVNVNVSYGVFHEEGKLEDIMNAFIRKWGNSHATLRKLGASLRGLRIEHSYLKDEAGNPIKRVRTIFDLASPEDCVEDKKKDSREASVANNNDSTENLPKFLPKVPNYGAKAREVEFRFKDNYITVLDFFKQEHNMFISETLPLINVGSHAKPTYLPADACKVLDRQRAKIIRYDKDMVSHIPIHSPSTNAKDIEENGLQAIGLANGDAHNKNRLDKFGLSVSDSKLVTVRGRKLPTPKIYYGISLVAANEPKNEHRHEDTNVNWNLAGVKLGHQTNKKRCQCVVVKPNQNDDKYLDVVKELSGLLGGNGVFINHPNPAVTLAGPSEIELEEVIKEKANNVDLLLVVLPTSDASVYSCIKRLGDITYGVPTLCILGNTLISPKATDGSSRNRRGNSPFRKTRDNNLSKSLSGNLALKLNLKFGNNNQRLDLAEMRPLDLRETMIVGIDVTHSPVPDQPSIAGMVASIDEKLGQWPAVLRHQEKARVEMVSQLKEMLETRLELWQSKHGKYPRNIIVYRDGVSEGQYGTVVKEELPKLREACSNQRYKPNITIIIVGKRHHTRFYTGKGRNPEPGTVVDRGITEVLNWDFFLQSHRPIRGTARPAHYFVVHDEIFRNIFREQAADKLEAFTHSLCFISGRTTNAVGICTPTYYADLACDRARCYVAAGPTRSTTSRAGTANSALNTKPPPPGSEGLLLHPRMKNSMFYI